MGEDTEAQETVISSRGVGNAQDRFVGHNVRAMTMLNPTTILDDDANRMLGTSCRSRGWYDLGLNDGVKSKSLHVRLCRCDGHDERAEVKRISENDPKAATPRSWQ